MIEKEGILLADTRSNRRSPQTPDSFLLGLAAVLFTLVAASTYLMGGLYARYAASGQGTDSARVAAFDVSVDKPEDISISYGITENDQADYTLTFHNDSEVAVSYSIRVVVDKAEEDFNIQVALEDQTLDTKNGTELDFGVVGHIPVGGTATEDLTFSVIGWNEFTKLGKGASRELTLDFTVYITIEQID